MYPAGQQFSAFADIDTYQPRFNDGRKHGPTIDFPNADINPNSVPSESMTGKAQFGRNNLCGWRLGEPHVEDNQVVRNWVIANYLMRPPITPEEIRAMPLMEIVALYYGLNKVRDMNLYYPNKVVCEGLAYAWDINLAFDIRQRIYYHRPDLRIVSHPNTGEKYRLLLPPFALMAPRESQSAAIAEGIIGAVSVLAVGLAGWVGVIVNAAIDTASAYYKAVDNARLVNLASKAKGLVGEVAQAILIGQATLKYEVNQLDLDKLKLDYQEWQRYIALIRPQIKTIMESHSKIGNPYGVLECPWAKGYTRSIINFYGVKQPQTGFTLDPSLWKPYEPYFYSKTVRDLILNPPKPAEPDPVLPEETNTTPQAEPDSASGLNLILFNPLD